MFVLRSVVCVAILALSASCGGGSPTVGSVTVVAVSPANFTVAYRGSALQFSAASYSSVAWSITGATGGSQAKPLSGVLSSNGLLAAYTSCAQPFVPGQSLSVTAVIAGLGSAAATGTVLIAPPFMTPFTMPTMTTVFFQPGDPCGIGGLNYTWSVEEGSPGGSVGNAAFASQGGAAIDYTSPSVPGTYHLLVQNGSANNSGVIIVQQPMPFGALEDVCRTGQTATLLKNGTLLIVGSSVDPDAGLNLDPLNVCAYSPAAAGAIGAIIYNPADDAFGSPATPAYASAGGQTATLLSDGRVLLAGGLGTGASQPGAFQLLSSAEIYDPATGTIAATGNMTTPRAFHTAALLPNGKVVIVGGAVDAPAELYDPSTGTFTAIAAPPIGPSRFYATATALTTGKILIAGGADRLFYRETVSPVLDAELYDPIHNSFTATGALQSPHFAHTATLLEDGSVLLVGGLASNHADVSGVTPNFLSATVSATAERYNPTSGSFASTSSQPNLPRAFHAATALPDGTVLLSGGLAQWPTLSASSQGYASVPIDAYMTEIYDPATGTFAAGPVTPGRLGLTATLLPNGTVVFIGGGPLYISLYSP